MVELFHMNDEFQQIILPKTFVKRLLNSFHL